MPYLWEQPNLGNNLYEMAIIRQKALLETTEDASEGTPSEQHSIELASDEDKGKVIEFVKSTIAGLDFSDDIKKKLLNMVQNTIDGKTIHGEAPKDKAEQQNVDNFANQIVNRMDKEKLVNFLTQQGNKLQEEPDSALDEKLRSVLVNTLKIGKNIASALIKAVKGNPNAKNFTELAESDPVKAAKALVAWGSNNKEMIAELANKENTSASEPNAVQTPKAGEPTAAMPEKVEMPPLFKTEPDDSMWQDIVVTEFGIPMINLSNPVAKKVITSEHPEQDCPGDLKQFKKAVHGDTRLQKVFGNGGIVSLGLGKAFNLLTLGIAAATTDAGKRADRIIKELKEKGGMTTHRNLLMVDYEDIINADPTSESTVKVKPFNRSKGQFLGELDIPATMLSQFYSCVDPINSPKIYVDMLSKDNSPLSKAESAKTEGVSSQGDPLVEGPLDAIKNTISSIKKGDNENSNDVNRTPEGKNTDNSGIKNNFIRYMSDNGHPPVYILKPKSANKEVVVVSTSGTGLIHGGKVNMVTLKVGDHQAAVFMTPKEIKQYFAV